MGLSDQLDEEEKRQGGITSGLLVKKKKTSELLVSCLNNQVDDGAKHREDGRRFPE